MQIVNGGLCTNRVSNKLFGIDTGDFVCKQFTCKNSHRKRCAAHYIIISKKYVRTAEFYFLDVTGLEGRMLHNPVWPTLDLAVVHTRQRDIEHLLEHSLNHGIGDIIILIHAFLARFGTKLQIEGIFALVNT